MVYDIVIIGGGVSGLTSAIYSASRGMKVCVIEAEGRGGTIGKVSQITHFPGIVVGESGKGYYARLLKQVMSYSDLIDLTLDKVISCKLSSKIKSIITEKNKYQAKSVIIACGCTPNKLGLYEEITYLNKGVSYTAIDDAQYYKDCEVFVVGGSDGALKEALYVANYAKVVHIVHFENELMGIAEFKDQILNDKEKFHLHLRSRIHEISGNNNFINKVILKNEDNNSLSTYEFDKTCLFIYIGSSPNSYLFADEIKLDNNYILSDENMKTNIDGVYVCGDIRAKKIRQVSTACSDATIAAINACTYVKNL